jgi:membrane protein YdbS with pleckstrin-like domain
MEAIDLKEMWTKAHSNSGHDKINIEETLKMNHSKIITKVLSDMRLIISGYALMLATLIGLMIYALLYLNLKLSANTLILFSFIGLFFAIKIASTISRLWIMTRTTDNLSLKESTLFIQRKLKRIKTIDFLTYLIYFYALAVWLTHNYINDNAGVKNLSWGNQIQALVIIAIILLLVVPWLIKYQHHQNYKKIYSDLNESASYLNEEYKF